MGFLSYIFNRYLHINATDDYKSLEENVTKHQRNGKEILPMYDNFYCVNI